MVSLRAAGADPTQFFEQHCYDCHDADEKKGGIDLTALKPDFTNMENFARWVKVYDLIESGEMPPKKKDRPTEPERAAILKELRDSLVTTEQARLQDGPRTSVRRLTRAEYENTMGDLFEMPGVALADELPVDGSAHGFDKNSDALDTSHVNVASYLAAADRVLDIAIATQPQAPVAKKQRLSLTSPGGGLAHGMLSGSAILLKGKAFDPAFPPTAAARHVGEGEHDRLGLYHNGSSVGIFNHNGASDYPILREFATLYPGRYRIRTSLWSFQWDKGKVLPSRGSEAFGLTAVRLTDNGTGASRQSSTLLGYYPAPSLEAQVHEVVQWLNLKDTIGFNAVSLPANNTPPDKGGVMGWSGPGLACDWVEIEGPLHEVWPSAAHRLLFGELPLVEWKGDAQPGVRPPLRKSVRQEVAHSRNQPDKSAGLWTVKSDAPLVDADRLLANFLPRAFRRPVAEEVRRKYVASVEARLKAGDCFESAMRWAYRTALCSSDFLFHLSGNPDDHALALRLSYFLWNSEPDTRLTELAATGKLRTSLRSEVERLLTDAKSQRFIDDFLGQWLKLRSIGTNDPDQKLYPDFDQYLQDSMVSETRSFFRELLGKNLDASHFIRSDFAMLNEKLARHYGIAGVSGPQIRRVALRPDCPRGGFLTQGAILKITANGTTTSPVPRGAFVLARLLGQPPEPPPPNTPAVEPDVQGTTTIREQLDKHRADPSCAACHAKIDPPGFALESFDVIGGQRKNYRAISNGPQYPRDNLDPTIDVMFRLGPLVDPSGTLADGRPFSGIAEFQALLANDPRLLKNLTEQFTVYATARPLAFSDRDEIAGIVQRTQKQGGGIRTLLHELVQSRLFQTP